MQRGLVNYGFDTGTGSSNVVELPLGPMRRRADNGCCRGMDWRSFGIILSLLAASSLALGVADVVITYQKYITKRDCPSKTSEPPCDPNTLVFTWVAAGIWASVPVFILGIVAIRLGRRNAPEKSSWFEILAFLCTFLFTPAMVALSVVEIWKGVGVYYWKAYNGEADDLVKAIIPIVIGSLGLVELLMCLIALSYVCCCLPQYAMDSYLDRPDTVSRTFLQARKPTGCAQCQSPYQGARTQVFPATQVRDLVQPYSSRAVYQTPGYSPRPSTYNNLNNGRPSPYQIYGNYRG